MEISSFRSLAELGMDDPLFFHQWPTNNSHVELSTESIASLIYEDFHHSFSQQPILDFKRAADSSGAGSIRPSKQLKPATWDSFKAGNMFMPDSNLTNPTLGNAKPKEETIWPSYNTTLNIPSESIASFGNQNNYSVKPTQGHKRLISTTNTRLGQTPQDHILAERRRREKISQRFIALSALVPGLKKMDKASVLGDAVKYLKQLQEKIKILEEQTKTRSMEKLVFVKKYEIYADGENSSSDENFSNIAPTVTEPLPEIQARFCGNDVLIIINCEKRKGLVEKAVGEIEKLNLSVVNSCVMSFGDSALNITLLAKKDDGFAMDMKELVNNLCGALKIFM